MTCTLYVDPASIVFPMGVYPMVPVHRRSRVFENRFKYGIIDSGINDLENYGEYRNLHKYPIKNLPEGWLWTIPDYPYDVLRNCSKNTRTEQECIDDSDIMIEKYIDYPQALPVLQYKFGDHRNLKYRLKEFPMEDYPRFGIGNTCKLKDKLKQAYVGQVILGYVPSYCNIHIFGCPTPLLRHLIAQKMNFSVDSNKFYRRHGRMCSGMAERSQFLREYMVDVGITVIEDKAQRKLTEWMK